MKNRSYFLLAAVLALAAMVALGAAIDGKWTAEVQGRNGTNTQTLTLKADGSKLAGTIEGGRGGAINISDGMIMGNDVMFKVTQEFNGNSFTRNFKGTLAGDELKLTATVEGGGGGGKGGRGGPQELTFKRAK